MAKAPAKSTKKKTFKKKEKKNVPYGVVHIQASFNNTIVTFTDPIGNVLAWSSSGSLGFRGSRKGTPFAAQQASLTAANKAKETGLRTVEVRVAGPGSGRESAVRALATAGIDVQVHQGRDADSAQRLPSAEEAPRLIRVLWRVSCGLRQASSRAACEAWSPSGTYRQLGKRDEGHA